MGVEVKGAGDGVVIVILAGAPVREPWVVHW